MIESKMAGLEKFHMSEQLKQNIYFFNMAVGGIVVLIVLLTIAAFLTLVKLCPGKPPHIYR